MRASRPTATEILDIQSLKPKTHLSLSRVGVTGVEKIIRIGSGSNEQLYYAELECFVDLNPKQMGVHMSRFEEIINEVIDEVVIGESFKAETLAAQVAELVRKRQSGLRAEVKIRARYPEHKQAPISGSQTQELYWMLATAVSSESGLRKLVGVEAQGMTACPCAQSLLKERAQARLLEAGFKDQQLVEIFNAVPVATHNQRGVGTLYVGLTEECDQQIAAEDLLEIVESSMSSEIYELLKRSDEAEIVEKAHANPRFVEDCVREMVERTFDRYAELGEQTFVLAKQENLETIHQHNVVAERFGTVAELRAELVDGDHLEQHTTARQWLEG